MAKKTGQANADPNPVDELSYESAVGELESIIERIESGEIGLEDSIHHYERGTNLLRRCRAILSRAEQRIERLDAGAIDSASADPDDA